jgi:hypothetical protein
LADTPLPSLQADRFFGINLAALIVAGISRKTFCKAFYGTAFPCRLWGYGILLVFRKWISAEKTMKLGLANKKK